MLWSDYSEIPTTQIHLHDSVESFFIQRQSIDLIISDIFLKQQHSGLSLLTKLRNDNNNTPLILISALDSTEITKKITHFPHIHFIQKPFNPQKILDLLKVERA
jgi:response regulator of citrate/malate metabolism